MPRIRFVHRYHDPRLTPAVAREAANDGWLDAVNSQPGADPSAPWGDFGARRPTLPRDDVGDLMRAIFSPPDWFEEHAARSDERQARAESRARIAEER